jgi:hypothetical protein
MLILYELISTVNSGFWQTQGSQASIRQDIENLGELDSPTGAAVNRRGMWARAIGFVYPVAASYRACERLFRRIDGNSPARNCQGFVEVM